MDAFVTTHRTRKRERQQAGHGLAVGDIVYSVWGYEQTNVTFYEVVRVPSGRSATVRDVNNAELLRLRETACKAAPIEIFQKRGHVVMRCGFAWYEPSTKTYIANSYMGGTEQ
ncbi:hypothetical protein [Stenotrophomonas maltophilia]|uniref:hypothetical protein n=1 Tax=Stenotrophomonas maltophilia TaxID=40324 RepID=UPI000C146185|nr:hypothetical protein [Stenotrophomonas maltophilia]